MEGTLIRSQLLSQKSRPQIQTTGSGKGKRTLHSRRESLHADGLVTSRMFSRHPFLSVKPLDAKRNHQQGGKRFQIVPLSFPSLGLLQMSFVSRFCGEERPLCFLFFPLFYCVMKIAFRSGQCHMHLGCVKRSRALNTLQKPTAGVQHQMFKTEPGRFNRCDS